MQAILTKYLVQTDSRGARIKATAADGSITIDYPHELSGEDVHRAAANALVEKLGWVGPRYGTLHGGQLPAGDYCFVLVTTDKEDARKVITQAIDDGQFTAASAEDFAFDAVENSRPVTLALGTERALSVIAACCVLRGA